MEHLQESIGESSACIFTHTSCIEETITTSTEVRTSIENTEPQKHYTSYVIENYPMEPDELTMTKESINGTPEVRVEQPDGHCGIQVVKVLEDHSYELDELELKNILMQEEIKDLPVVVVSVAGVFRGGKSFLLNFFIRYLNSSEAARLDGSWLGKNSDPLTGFSWRCGSKRDTTGILIWSKPVVIKKSSGEKVAVILLDTQGTFDNESTLLDCSTIFALSTLLSSVQIYNLHTNIREDNMQHLQLFIEYGKLVSSSGSSVKPFQVLEFLVRDWPYDYEYCYGAAGGQRKIKEILAVSDKTPKEIKVLRKLLIASFEKISAFLMPYPGPVVVQPSFNGSIGDLNHQFRIHLIELVKSLFSPENLIIKTINGENILAKDLFTYFKTYMSILNSNTLPTPENILEATKKAIFMTASNDARDQYTKSMDAECGPEQPSLPAADLQFLHRKYVAKARETFINKKKMGAPEEGNFYLENIIKELESRLPQTEMNNQGKLESLYQEARIAYDKILKNVTQDNQLCLHPQDLEELHKEGLETAFKVFDANRKTITVKVDKDRVKLKQNLEDVHNSNKTTNMFNNNNYITELCAQYSKYMEDKCNLPVPLREEDFKVEHDKAMKVAQDGFEKKRNQSNLYPEDGYKKKLQEEIRASFNQINTLNNNNYKAMSVAMMRKATDLARQLYESEMQKECGSEHLSMTNEDVTTLHRKFVEEAKHTYATNVTMGTKEESNTYLQGLITELEGRLQQYQQNNYSKLQATIRQSEKAYYKLIEFDHTKKNQPLCLHELDLIELHKLAVVDALQLFVSNRKIVFSKSDEERIAFEKSFDDRLENLKKYNDQNNMTMVVELRTQYSKFMETKCAIEPPLQENDFKIEHDNGLRNAEVNFDSKRNKSNSYTEDKYKSMLITEINTTFNQLNAINTSKYNATSQATKEKTMNEARKLYDNKMMAKCGSGQPSFPDEDVQALHDEYLKEAKDILSKTMKTATEQEKNKYLAELTQEMEGRLLMFKQYNTSKLQEVVQMALDVYEETVNKIASGRQICVHPDDLEKAHANGVIEAMKVYDAKRKSLTNKKEEMKNHFKEMLNKRYRVLKLTNEMNNETLVKEIHTEYWKAMENACSHIPPYSEKDFENEHTLANTTALNELKKYRNTDNKSEDVYKNNLNKTILSTYNNFQKINNSRRIQDEILKSERANNKEEQERLKKEQEKTRKLQEEINSKQQDGSAQWETVRLEQEKIRKVLEQNFANNADNLRKQHEETIRGYDLRLQNQYKITSDLERRVDELSRRLTVQPVRNCKECIIL